jgi:pSer/pThr/pTyr-binding forkhead associated (FHA) protein
MSDGGESTQILSATPTAAQPWRAGADLSRQEACPHCQATIPSGEEFCPRCGYQRGTWLASPAANGAAESAAPLGTAPATPLVLRAADGRAFGLPAGETVAGRGDVALRLDDGFISRQHAKFSVEGDEVQLTDLGSSNGTFIGEQRLAPQVATALPLGASFRLGQLELTLERNAAAGAPDGDSTAMLETQPAAAEPALALDGPAATEAAPVTAGLSAWALRGADGLVLNLPLGDVTLGRKAEQNGLVIPDGYISGRHCAFAVAADSLSVTDLGSTNGSFINGVRLERDAPHELKAGDALRLGQTELAVEFSGETSDEAEPEPAAAIQPAAQIEAEPA